MKLLRVRKITHNSSAARAGIGALLASAPESLHLIIAEKWMISIIKSSPTTHREENMRAVAEEALRGPIEDIIHKEIFGVKNDRS